MNTLIGRTLSVAVLVSGCTKTVCSKTWLNCYVESLSSEELDNIKHEQSETISIFAMERFATPSNGSQYQ